MATAEERFEDGDLRGAVAAQTEAVKAAPADVRRRTFLFELLCFAGELDRAAKQLEVIAHQDRGAEGAVQVYRNLLHAEERRRRVFTDGAAPELLLDAPQWLTPQLDAARALYGGDAAAAATALAATAGQLPAVAGSLEDVPFDDFRDCDDLLGPVLELIILRDYVWLPLNQIRELEVLAPETARDLIWAPVRLVLVSEAPHRGYVPVLYPFSHLHSDDAVRLGHRTEWLERADGPAQGQGRRLFLVGDEARDLFELTRVTLTATA